MRETPDPQRQVTRLLRRGAPGQIATLLMLCMAAMLIFALAMANLGRTAHVATRLANAADSAALLLGSQLATKSYTVWKGMGQRTQKCQRTGILSSVTALVAAIVTYLVLASNPATAPFAIPGAIAAGAAGGAAGGEIAGTGAAQGAIQGAQIGAAVAGGFTIGAQIGAAYAGPLGATANVAVEAGPIAAIGASEVAISVPVAAYASIPSTVAAAAGTTAGLAVVGGSTLAFPGAIAGALVSAGTNIYNARVEERIKADQFETLAKALRGLPEREQFQEGAIVHALTQVVDDPNLTDGTCHWPEPFAVTGDPNDANGNGNTRERISCFAYWLDRRIGLLKQGAIDIERPVFEFLQGPLAAFEEVAEQSTGAHPCGGGDDGDDEPPPPPPPPPPDPCPSGECERGGN